MLESMHHLGGNSHGKKQALKQMRARLAKAYQAYLRATGENSGDSNGAVTLDPALVGEIKRLIADDELAKHWTRWALLTACKMTPSVCR